MLDNVAESLIAIILILFVVFAIAGLIAVICVVFISHKKERKPTTNTNTLKETSVERSYKQEMYLESLRGNENSPYFGSNKISQTTYDAFSDYIFELFGYEKGSEKSKEKMRYIVGKFVVLPDGDINITWPRTSTKSFINGLHFFSRFFEVDDERIMFIFHESHSVLYKKLVLFFEKRQVEIRAFPRIKPYPKEINKYVIIKKESEESGFLYYVLKQYYGKERSCLGFAHHMLPGITRFEDYKVKTMKKYNLKTDYEFMRYLLAFYFDSSNMKVLDLRTPTVSALRCTANHWNGGNQALWDHFKRINKELNKELRDN